VAKLKSHLWFHQKNHKVSVSVGFSHMDVKMVSLFVWFLGLRPVPKNGLNRKLKITELCISSVTYSATKVLTFLG